MSSREWNRLSPAKGRFHLDLVPRTRSRVRRISRVLKWIAIGLIGFSLWYHAPVTPIGRNWAKELASELSDRYGIVVRYTDPSNFRVASLETFGDVLSVAQLDERNVLTALRGVRSALSVYPPELVRQQLGAIFLTGELETQGIKIGGTYLHDWIYVSGAGLRGFWAENLVALSVHHEFSSLLFHNSEFPDFAWRSVNDTSFTYLEDPDAVLQAADKRRDAAEADQWHRAGFVSDYGMSSLENDLNTFAELAFGSPAELVELAQRYPKVGAKLSLLVDFYQGLTPQIGDYFSQNGLTAAAKRN